MEEMEEEEEEGEGGMKGEGSRYGQREINQDEEQMTR